MKVKTISQTLISLLFGNDWLRKDIMRKSNYEFMNNFQFFYMLLSPPTARKKKKKSQESPGAGGGPLMLILDDAFFPWQLDPAGLEASLPSGESLPRRIMMKTLWNQVCRWRFDKCWGPGHWQRSLMLIIQGSCYDKMGCRGL